MLHVLLIQTVIVVASTEGTGMFCTICLELGAWSLELGAWSLELGAWSLELGVDSTYCVCVVCGGCRHGKKDSIESWRASLGTVNLGLGTVTHKVSSWTGCHQQGQNWHVGRVRLPPCRV
jgi:hypothetical protein